MNGTMAAGNCALSLVEENQNQTSNSGFPSDLLDFYGEAMDRAWGIEKASLSAISQVNSCALDSYERLACDFMGAAVAAISSCLQAQLSWLTILLPRACEGSETALTAGSPAGRLADVDHHMDVAMGTGSGELLPGMAVSIADAGSPVGQAQPAETVERCMDLVIGEVAA